MELGRFSRFTLVYILVTIVADGLGLLLGALVNPVVSIKNKVDMLFAVADIWFAINLLRILSEAFAYFFV